MMPVKVWVPDLCRIPWNSPAIKRSERPRGMRRDYAAEEKLLDLLRQREDLANGMIRSALSNIPRALEDEPSARRCTCGDLFAPWRRHSGVWASRCKRCILRAKQRAMRKRDG